MPKRKPVAASQPSLSGIPAPELKPSVISKSLSTLSRPQTSRPASDLFIVDNGNDEWKAARYLRDWCELARAFDIATGYFEIGSLLAARD
jgi:hypothetical protein